MARNIQDFQRTGVVLTDAWQAFDQEGMIDKQRLDNPLKAFEWRRVRRFDRGHIHLD